MAVHGCDDRSRVCVEPADQPVDGLEELALSLRLVAGYHAQVEAPREERSATRQNDRARIAGLHLVQRLTDFAGQLVGDGVGRRPIEREGRDAVYDLRAHSSSRHARDSDPATSPDEKLADASGCGCHVHPGRRLPAHR
jgi:hypothetical protein